MPQKVVRDDYVHNVMMWSINCHVTTTFCWGGRNRTQMQAAVVGGGHAVSLLVHLTKFFETFTLTKPMGEAVTHRSAFEIGLALPRDVQRQKEKSRV